jgi:hypothetical protein
VFVLLTLGELVAGRSIPIVPTVAVLVVVAWSIVWNLGELQEGSDLQRMRAEEMRAQLAAVELAGGSIDPDMRVGRFLLETRAGPWLEVAERYGSPAYSLDELRDAPTHARRAADRVLVRGSGLELGAAAFFGECTVDPSLLGQPGPLEFELDGGVSGTTVRVGALAEPRAVGRIAPGERASLVLPGLADGQRWNLETDGSGHLCAVSTAP